LRFRDTGGTLNNLNGIEFATNLINFQVIYYTNLTNLSKLSTLTNLRELYFYNNGIINLSPLSTLVNLQSVEIQNNKIIDILPLANLNNLIYLNISGNIIYLQNQAALDIHRDLTLLLGASYLEDLPPPDEVVIFQDPELRKCALVFFVGDSNSKMNITKTNLGTIQTIECYEPIKVVSDFKYAINLENATFWNADFSTFPDFRDFNSIIYLSAINSNITNVNPLFLDNLNNLIGINFSNNLITDMSFLDSINSSSLQEIELQNNLITDIPVFSGFPNPGLYYLNINNNPITLNNQSDVVGHNFLLNYFTNYNYDYPRGLFGIFNFSVISELKNVTLNPGGQISTFDFSGLFTLTDTRDSLSGDHLSGWNIQAEVTDLVDGTKVIPKNQIVFKNLNSIIVDGYNGSAVDVNGSSPITLLSLPSGSGAGIHTIDFSNINLDVSLLPTTRTGNYSGSLNLQLVTGP
jgi:Leucine-rich repeat (LRR) protein